MRALHYESICQFGTAYGKDNSTSYMTTKIFRSHAFCISVITTVSSAFPATSTITAAVVSTSGTSEAANSITSSGNMLQPEQEQQLMSNN